MPRGSTALDSHEYDDHLNQRAREGNRGAERELRQRKMERARAQKRDGSGWRFDLGDKPVKSKDMNEFRQNLEKRGLAIEGEYGGKKNERRG